MKRYLLVAALIVLIIALSGWIWSQAVPGQPHLVCTIGGEVVFDEPFDSVTHTPYSIKVTRNGHTQTVYVPEGMECQ